MPDSKHATKPTPNRRGLLQGIGLCALPVRPSGSRRDPGRLVAERWCALEAEQRRLVRQWQGLETWLFTQHDWPRLSDAQRAAIPEAAQLSFIDEQLDGLNESYDALLPHLKATRATTREGVFARFEALLDLLVQDEHPNGRALLKSCLGDLKRLWV